MTTTLFDEGGVVLIKRDDRYYVRYDAGAHMMQLREDEVTSEDAKRLMRGDPHATEVLFDLQRRLLASGEDPYVSNIT